MHLEGTMHFPKTKHRRRFSTDQGAKAHMYIPDARLRSSSKKLAAAVIRGVSTLAVLSALLMTAAHRVQAQTESILYSFTCGTDGCVPYAGVTLDKEDNLYGTTYAAGASCCGTVFKLTTVGPLTTLYSFGNNGFPRGGVVLDHSGNIYGTTTENGVGDGSVFKVAPSGSETALQSFNYLDGAAPFAGVVLDSKDDLYGTTYAGGAFGQGTIFKLSRSGTFTTLYSFCSVCRSAPMGRTPLRVWCSTKRETSTERQCTVALPGSGRCSR